MSYSPLKIVIYCCYDDRGDGDDSLPFYMILPIRQDPEWLNAGVKHGFDQCRERAIEDLSLAACRKSHYQRN